MNHTLKQGLSWPVSKFRAIDGAFSLNVCLFLLIPLVPPPQGVSGYERLLWFPA
jgi:hypothetical protein